jgi:hypothetical protein
MRSIGVLALGIAFGVGLTGNAAFAQVVEMQFEIEVQIGPDGVVKILDARTGKVIDDAVLKALTKPGPALLQPLDKKQTDELRQALERAIEAEFKAKDDPKAKPKPIPFDFKFPVDPFGGKQPDKKQIEEFRKLIEEFMKDKAKGQDAARKSLEQARKAMERAKQLRKDQQAAPATPAGVDQKLDQILKQLGDLRKDVDAIKKKLDVRPSDTIRPWPPFGPPMKIKEVKPGVFEIEVEIEKLVPNKADKADKAKKPAKDEPADETIQKALQYLRAKQLTPQASTPETKRIEELERAVERLRQEIELLKKAK